MTSENHDRKVNRLWVGAFTSVSGKKIVTRAKVNWKRIHTRTNNETFLARNPTYAGTSIGFADYQEFAEWSNNQFGYHEKDKRGQYWSLDKDIIKPGNKVYAPDVCCFVPSELNVILIAHSTARGEFPIGVHKGPYGKFVAQCSFGGKQNYLGSFETAHAAHREWQKAKIKALRDAVVDYAHLPKPIVSGVKKHLKLIKADYKAGIETER